MNGHVRKARIERFVQLADILALSPRMENGSLKLTVVVTEAKYVDASSLAAKKKESQKQLRETHNRINEAVLGDPLRVDRDSWLYRLSDLILDGVLMPASSSVDLLEWRRPIREGRCEFVLRGYSHIFVPTSVDAFDPSDAADIGTEGGFQEIFGRARLRELLPHT